MLQKKNDTITENNLDMRSGDRNFVPSGGDTTAAWRTEVEAGNLAPMTYYWYNTADTLTNQPSTYGHMVSLHPANVGTEFFQIWKTAPNGELYHRGCNGSNTLMENQQWRELLDSQNWLDKVYPVGSIYLSVDETNPATKFGGGTWTRLQNGFMYAATGTGARTGNGTGTNTGSTAITVAQMPSHGHPVYVWDNAGTTGNAYYYNGATKTTHSGARLYNASASAWIASGSTAAAAGSGRGDPSGSTGLIGSGQGHTHTIPWISVVMWQRTA